MTRVFNRSEEKLKRKALRNKMPRAELLLWAELKGNKLSGFKFRRQYGVGGFVIDFYCPKLKLAIEVDGESHSLEGAAMADKERQAIIETYGIEFLRFRNDEIYGDLDGVLMRIGEWVEKQS